MRPAGHIINILKGQILTPSQVGGSMLLLIMQKLRRHLKLGFRKANLDRDLSWIIKKLTLSRYKYAVCYLSKNEHVMRADSLAEKLLNKNVIEFSKEVRTINRSNTLLPSTIEGVSGADRIAELWKQNYSALFNCIKSDSYKVGNIANRDAVGITTIEVFEAIA